MIIVLSVFTFNNGIHARCQSTVSRGNLYIFFFFSFILLKEIARFYLVLKLVTSIFNLKTLHEFWFSSNVHKFRNRLGILTSLIPPERN